jgi:arginase
MGHRADLDDDTRQEVALVDERIQLVEAKAIRRGDPQSLGRYVAQRLQAQAGRFWLHFDADVFDEGEMPAVTYPQPDGLSWDRLGDLLRPLASSPALVGISVADYVPDKDSDGHHARRLVELVGGLLAQRKENT